LSLAERLREEGRNEGKEKWMNEGRKKGKTEGMFEAARRMWREDFPIEQIVKFTGLSEAQLRKAFSEK
jgi:predicted transposase/invertase (TIGR01784 family)